MPTYITRDEFRYHASNMSAQSRIDIRRLAENRSPQGATFLSHSSKDNELVLGAMRILENHGASIYIDKKDPALPPYTSKETAATLKTRINQSKRFVLLATENSKDSKWVPWELGVADGYKRSNQIALLPAVEKSYQTSWTSSEYLGLYDRIVWGKLEGYEKNVWMVLDQDKNIGTELRRWLGGY